MLRLLRETMWDRKTGLLGTVWFPVVICLIGFAVFAVPAVLSGDATASGWGYDFYAFRLGAEMTADGRLVDAYDPAAFAEALLPRVEEMYWMYPPHGALLLSPLSFGGWGAAGTALALLVGASVYGAGRLAGGGLREGSLLLLLSLPSVYALMLGQLAPLFGALIIFALLEGRTRPIMAGLALAIVTVKPQYGLVVPLFLLIHGQGRTIAAATAATLALVGLSLAVFGPEAWAAWAQNADGPARDFIYENRYPSMPSWYQYAMFLGVPATMAKLAQVAALLCGLGVVWWTRRLPYDVHVAATLLVTSAVMPYLWFYDWLPVMGAVLILIRTGARVPTSLLVAVWLVPFASELHEGVLPGLGHAMGLATVNLINAVEVAALWGLIGWLVVSARPRSLAAEGAAIPA